MKSRYVAISEIPTVLSTVLSEGHVHVDLTRMVFLTELTL